MATDVSDLQKAAERPTRLSVAGVLAIAIGIVVSGVLSGRVWWCEAGDLWPWSWDVWSRHCSQHLIDPYSLSHLQHGIGLYLIVTVLWCRRLSLDTGSCWLRSSKRPGR